MAPPTKQSNSKATNPKPRKQKKEEKAHAKYPERNVKKEHYKPAPEKIQPKPIGKPIKDTTKEIDPDHYHTATLLLQDNASQEPHFKTKTLRI